MFSNKNIYIFIIIYIFFIRILDQILLFKINKNNEKYKFIFLK